MPNQGVPAGIAFVELRLSNTDFITEPIRRQTQRAADQGERNLREGLTRGAQGAAKGISKAMSVVGAAGGAALAAGIAEGLDVQAANSKLKGQLGLTVKESGRVGKVAGDLFANAYGESMEEVNDAIKSVVQNMDGMRTASSSVLKDTARDALNLSNIMGEDVGKVTQAVANIMRNKLAKSSKEAFDVITVGVQRGANKAEDLLDTFVEYSVQFRKLGLDAKTATGILQQGLQGGARDADTVADALKEFSIRAVDMSDTSIEAFKQLGLNGAKMSQQIARGGTGASQGLQLVLDRLRAIDDPVKREAAAVGLFGTKAEDLGKALFAINPTTAVQSLGKVTGAANELDTSLGDNAQTTFTAWKRQMQASIVNVIVQEVLPRLQDLTTALNAMGLGGGGVARLTLGVLAFAAAWKTAQLTIAIVTRQVLGLSIAGAVANATKNVYMFVAALRNMNLAYAANATLGARLGGAIRAQIVLWQAQAAATNRSTAAVIANAAASRVAAAATRVWAIAVAIFNAVVNANPISLIVIAIIALIAIVVLTYNKVGWFRAFVDAAFAAIKNAVMTAWNFIKPTFMQFAHILVNVVGTALRWYWAYVKFVFTTVWTIIQFAWNFIKPIFMQIVAFLTTTFRIAWIVIQNTVKIVWIAIQIYIKIAWLAIKGYFNLIKFYITNVLAPIFKWLYNNVVRPIWNAIKASISSNWNAIKVVWNLIKAFLSGVLAPAFQRFKDSASRAWNAIKSVISSVYNGGIKPVFDKLRNVLGMLGGWFRTAVGAIKSQWDKLQGVAKTPVNFVIGIYNKGIVGLVNKLADFAGVKTRLNEIPRLARGGTLTNPLDAAPMMTNGPLAIVGEGRKQYPEFVIPTDPRHRKRAQALWAMAGQKVVGSQPADKWLSGRNALSGEGMAFARGGSLQTLAFGGIIGDFVKGVKDFTIGNIAKGAERLLSKVLGGTVPGSGQFRDVVSAIPGWIKNSLVDWVKKKVATFGGGPSMERALNWAKTQSGKPYQWGGNGNPSWDCSGFMSAIESVIRGEKPHRRWATSSFNGGVPPGWTRNAKSGFMIGVLDNGNAHASHTAGTLLGKNVESSGSGGVRVGGGARGFNDGMFPAQYGFRKMAAGGILRRATYDRGGMLMPGYTLAYNGTGKPEPVLARGKDDGFRSMRPGGSGGKWNFGPELNKALAALIKQVKSGMLTSVDSINKFFASFNATIKKFASGNAEKNALKTSAAIQKSLQAAATKAAAIATAIQQARDYAKSVADSAREFGSIQNIPGHFTSKELLAGLTERSGEISKFASQITALKKRGVAQSILSQIIAMGPRQGSELAASLLKSDSKTIGDINKAQGSLDKAANSLGQSAANAMFDSGKNIGKGFLSGLLAQQAEINKYMQRLGQEILKGLQGKLRGKKGSPLKNLNDSGFRAIKMDTGGSLRPGWNPPMLNKTGHPEPILNPSQARLVERSLDATVSGQGGTIDNRISVYPQRANFTIQDLEALERRRDAKARVGRPK